MTGAQSLVKSLIASGIDTCFANPGTSEMHFVAALDELPGIRCVLGLQENAVTGMADGFWRMARKPACTLLHCGPGLANGFANLHNARRARSGILNIVGDQATYHRQYDAALTTDTQGIARATSHWVRTSSSASAVAQDAMTALQIAQTARIATLILPSDVSWDAGGVVAAPLPPLAPLAADPLAVDNCARALRDRATKTLVLLGGDALLAEGQGLAGRIAQKTEAALLAEYAVGRVERGQGRLALERMPYSVDASLKVLAQYQRIVLAGALSPVAFFAYPGKPSSLVAPDAEILVLARPDQDVVGALRALAEALAAPALELPPQAERPGIVQGASTPEGLARTLAAVLPDQAIICDESVSYGRGFYPHTHGAAAHDWLHQTGGAIGLGLPMATGAAMGAPGRRVISLQADGSAMYSLQALWTQAREQLPCTTIILSNRKYNILIGEYRAVGTEPGATAMQMLDLGRPDLDWVRLAGGMGVEAARAATLEECADLLRTSFSRPEPFLIELLI